MVTNFEIFRMREKQVPVDVVEMKGKNCAKKHKRLNPSERQKSDLQLFPFQKAS